MIVWFIFKAINRMDNTGDIDELLMLIIAITGMVGKLGNYHNKL